MSKLSCYPNLQEKAKDNNICNSSASHNIVLQARHERCNTCFSNAIELFSCVMRIIASLIMLDRVTGSLNAFHL